MTSKKPIALFAIDIETDGPRADENNMLSIGVCLGDLDGNVITCRRFDMKPVSGRYAEKETMNTFWVHHKDVLEAIRKDASEVKHGLAAFEYTLDKADNDYDLRILTDNPSFDIAFINAYFEQYFTRLPLNYRHGKRDDYRPVFDTDSFNRAAIAQPHDSAWTSDANVMERLGIDPASICAADHLPENDAKRIYQLHVAVLKALAKKRKSNEKLVEALITYSSVSHDLLSKLRVSIESFGQKLDTYDAKNNS